MNSEMIKSLFTLFSGEIYCEEYFPFFRLAEMEVEKILLPDADRNDEKLDYLCAAVMNYRYRQAMCSAENSEYTYGGAVNSTAEKKNTEFSVSLLRSYIQLCSGLVEQNDFVFAGFS